jgi:dTDP-4-amino-4,6-dideoxygalactose transaminase
VDKYTWVDIGSSFLPSELVGAFLYAQLEQADRIVEVRKRIFNRYLDAMHPLEEQDLVRLPFVDNKHDSNGHIFYIILHSLEERTMLINHLKANNILAVFHYVPLHSSPAGIQYGRTSGDLNVTDKVSDCLLRLPLYYEITDEDVNTIIRAIFSFFKVAR